MDGERTMALRSPSAGSQRTTRSSLSIDESAAPLARPRAEAASDGEALLAYAMERFGSMVLRIAIAHTGSRHDAEDVAQDVFVRLITSTPRLTGIEHLKAWLIRTTVNRCRDVARKRAREKADPIHNLPFDIPAPSNAHVKDELQATWEAIQALPNDERAIVHLVCYEGCSYRETARALGLSEGAVRARLHKARTYLRAACDHDEESEATR